MVRRDRVRPAERTPPTCHHRPCRAARRLLPHRRRVRLNSRPRSSPATRGVVAPFSCSPAIPSVLGLLVAFGGCLLGASIFGARGALIAAGRQLSIEYRAQEGRALRRRVRAERPRLVLGNRRRGAHLCLDPACRRSEAPAAALIGTHSSICSAWMRRHGPDDQRAHPRVPAFGARRRSRT